MNLVFSGILREGCDASTLFEKLEEYGTNYDVDVVSGNIIIDDIKPGTRDEIVREVNKVFEILHITTKNFEKDNVEVVTNKTEYEIAFEKLRDTLFHKQLSDNALSTCIHNMLSDVVLIKKYNCLYLNVGEIVTCNFGFGLGSENRGYMNVIILAFTEQYKFLVVPIDFHSSLTDDGRFCMKVRTYLDATYYNDTYKQEESLIYLNRIQEVKISRLSTRIGVVTKHFLNSIFENLYVRNYEKIPLTVVMEELFSPATERVKNKAECNQLESFFEFVKIPNNLMLLRDAFSKALLTKDSTLKRLIPLLQENSEIDLSKTAVETNLRTEFVTWLNSIYPDIFEEYDRISLANVLKVFLKKMA